jgi:hypothetical protein
MLVRDCNQFVHVRMARGGHGLPKVSPRLALHYLSMPCGQATPETALQPVLGVARPQGGRHADVFYPFRHPTLYAYAFVPSKPSSLNRGIRMRGKFEIGASIGVQHGVSTWVQDSRRPPTVEG